MKNNPRLEAQLAEKGWLTVQAAATLAGVGTSTIYRWLDGQELEEHKVGARRYVSRASVIRAANLDRVDGAPPAEPAPKEST